MQKHPEFNLLKVIVLAFLDENNIVIENKTFVRNTRRQRYYRGVWMSRKLYDDDTVTVLLSCTDDPCGYEMEEFSFLLDGQEIAARIISYLKKHLLDTYPDS